MITLRDITRRMLGKTLQVIAAAAVLAVVLLLILGPGFEENFLSTPASFVEVSIVSLNATTGADEDGRPTTFRYTARLPDGSEARFSSRRGYREGDRVVVLASRGRITGILRLRDPIAR